MIKLTSVKVVDSYRLAVQFEDGTQGVCDISPYLEKGDFQELKDESLFREAFCTGWSVEWPNELDLSADTIRHLITAQSKSNNYSDFTEPSYPMTGENRADYSESDRPLR